MSSLEKNKEMVRRFCLEGWGNPKSVELIVDRNCMLHFRNFNVNVWEARNMWNAAVPDLVFKVKEIIAEGSIVAARLRFIGTHSGEFAAGQFKGIEPHGKKIDVTEMIFVRIEDGKIVEIWEDYDAAGMMQQIA